MSLGRESFGDARVDETADRPLKKNYLTISSLKPNSVERLYERNSLILRYRAIACDSLSFRFSFKLAQWRRRTVSFLQQIICKPSFNVGKLGAFRNHHIRFSKGDLPNLFLAPLHSSRRQPKNPSYLPSSHP